MGQRDAKYEELIENRVRGGEKNRRKEARVIEKQSKSTKTDAGNQGAVSLRNKFCF
jgi:hypothetical protein